MSIGECHNRYALVVVLKAQSQRCRLRGMAVKRRPLRALGPLRQRSKKACKAASPWAATWLKFIARSSAFQRMSNISNRHAWSKVLVHVTKAHLHRGYKWQFRPLTLLLSPFHLPVHPTKKSDFSNTEF